MISLRSPLGADAVKLSPVQADALTAMNVLGFSWANVEAGITQSGTAASSFILQMQSSAAGASG